MPKPKRIEKALLPFATCSQEKTIFNDEVEKATVFCLSELNREKEGGFLKKRDAEKLIFISKVYYPFWIMPVREMTVLLDGLNTTSHEISYPALPNLKSFKEILKDQPITHQVYANFLSNNQNFFQSSTMQQELVEGLLNDSKFTIEFLEYTKEATTIKSPVVDSVLITPALDKEDVSKTFQRVENTRLNLKEDLADLTKIIKLLNLKSQKSLTSLQKKIKITKADYNKQIQKGNVKLKKKVGKINKAYSYRVKKVTKKFEQKITDQHKKILKIEKTKAQLELEIKNVESEIKNSAINKDDTTQQRWKEKRKQLKNKYRKITSKLKKLNKQLLNIEDKRKNELFHLKQNFDAKTKKANKVITEIEASRDAKIKTYSAAEEKIEDLTTNIIEKINELAKNREEVILEFDELGIRQRKANVLLVYLPFYLSCFQRKSAKRYIYLVPSAVSDQCFSARLKALGKARISQLLQPRFDKLTSILNSFMCLLDENIVFNREISEACMKANLLQMKKAQEIVRKGLSKLNEQGWVSNSEFESFNQEVSYFC